MEMFRLTSSQALWSHADRAFGEVTTVNDDPAARRDALRRLRSSLAVLAMVAAGKPDEVLDRLPLLLKVCWRCCASAVSASLLICHVAQVDADGHVAKAP